MTTGKAETPVKYHTNSDMWIHPRLGGEFISFEHDLALPKLYYIHHPVPSVELNRWGKWDKVWSMREKYIQPPALHIFHSSVFMSFFQHLGHHSLTSYPVHWFPLSNLSSFLTWIFATYRPSPSYFSGEMKTISLATAEWGVLSSQVQGDGRLGCLASAHFIFTGCYWVLMNTKLQRTWEV